MHALKDYNRYMKCYDDYKEFITYLDGNHLCGWAMSQYLLYNRFKWLNQKEIDRFDVSSYSEK